MAKIPSVVSTPLRAALSIGLALLWPLSASAALRNINNPSGGIISLGSLDGVSTPQQAMGAMLKAVAQRCGDRPQLGRGMRDPTGQTLAVFFNVKNTHAKTAAEQPVSGLVIAAVVPGQGAKVALLTDVASRFATSLPAMLQRLRTEAESAKEGQEPQGSPAPAAGESASLQPYRFPDGTGSIGLPAGWKVLEVAKGAVHATGPDGGWLIFGANLSVMDPRVPGAHAYANNISIVPFGTEPIAMYTSVVEQVEKKQHNPPPAIHISKVQPGPNNQDGTSWILFGDYDRHDGHGPMTLRAQVRWGRPNSQGFYTLQLYEIAGPPASPAAQDATVMAVFKSYNANSLLIAQQMVAQGRQNWQTAQQFVARAQRNEDLSERNTQAFSNILLNQTVVRDTEYNAHGTFDNDFSSALIKSNPDRFQEVPPSEFVKGIDY